MQIALDYTANTGTFQGQQQVVFLMSPDTTGKFGTTVFDLREEDGRLLNLLLNRGVARYVEIESAAQVIAQTKRLLNAEAVKAETEGEWTQLQACQQFLAAEPHIESIAVCDTSLFDNDLTTTLDVRFHSLTANQRYRVTVTLQHPAVDEGKPHFMDEVRRLLEETRKEILRLKLLEEAAVSI